VLAYSTVSQLGYMFAAIGASAYTAAMFHVTTHAFFKALLFLCAGSVIHAVSGEQDMRRMGGLKGKLRITFITMLIGTMAITGVPLLSGFFSKDEILLMVLDRSSFAFILLAITTVLTAIYMFRLLFMTFYGHFRGTHEQEHHLHESPTSMTMPLMILAVLSVVGGYLGLPHLSGLPHALHSFLHPIFEANTRLIMSEPSATNELLVVAGATLSLIIVIYFTYRTFATKPVAMHVDMQKQSIWYRLSYNKFYVDEIYDNVIVKPVVSASQALYLWIDNLLVDGTVNGLGRLAMFTSSGLRQLQSGNIGFYVLVMVFGVVGMIFFYVVKGYAF
jgi:NADH-quinone oxidoreductase subunit L